MSSENSELLFEIYALYEKMTGKSSPKTAHEDFDEWFKNDFVANQGNVTPKGKR
jgi:hypothetical protein